MLRATKSVLALVCVALGATVGAIALGGGGGADNPGGGPGWTDDTGGSGAPRAFFRRFTVPFATGNTTFTPLPNETVLSVTNGSAEPVDVFVEWYFASGPLAATSAVFTIPPFQEQRFVSTADGSRSLQPFWNGGGSYVYLPGAPSFIGFAYVYTGPRAGSGKNVTVEAALLTLIGNEANGNAQSVSELKVLRSREVNGIDYTNQVGD